MKEHDHCWHTGSGMDHGTYRGDGSGNTVTYLICCHCGEVKTERREWFASKIPADGKKHGEHDWLNAEATYAKNFK
jgi:hypothetical protein